MKYPLLLAAIIVSLGFFAPPAPAQTQSPVTFDTFFQELSPYGDWMNVDGYGMSWRPRVDSGWRPYTDGRWAQTDAGWTWMSNEPWGWITYHYGRWTTLDDGGWIWVPGYEWAPAWVSWRTNDDYVGWAPLPPEAVWEPSTGFTASVDVSYGIGVQVYTFCPVQYLGWPALRPVLMPVGQNPTILPHTANVTAVSVRNNAIYCSGPDYAVINRRGQYAVPQYQLQRSQVAGEWPGTAEQQTLLKQGVLAVRSPKVYPIFSATSQRSVTTQAPHPRAKPDRRPANPASTGTQAAAQPTPTKTQPSQPAPAAQAGPIYDVTVGQEPGQAPGYTVSGVQVTPQQNPSNVPPQQPQNDYRGGNAQYRQQQAQQAQIDATRQQRQAQQDQPPQSATEIRIQQQQQQMQDRTRQIQEAQQEHMRQIQQNQAAQQQQQAEALQQQREAMQRQLQQQQDRQRQQQQSQQQPQQAPQSGSSQHQPRSQQTPPPGSGWKTFNTQ